MKADVALLGVDIALYGILKTLSFTVYVVQERAVHVTSARKRLQLSRQYYTIKNTSQIRLMPRDKTFHEHGCIKNTF